ncbi:DMT family transporter [Acholeplasma manati]|uniref:DMT family transporter n=1 Tax=Paracholeplasma manati TaxID=591373 RepID=A0ABT2Y3X1_9MOLU|nr:DMT family transporter [Paracholeplasma manati]MCV2231436.1 DMT family transporter [Paracholeplasma manati]
MKKKTIIQIAISYAIVAALFYGLSAPLSKLLLNKISPYTLSSMLYFGAGLGMFILVLGRKTKPKEIIRSFHSKDIQYIILMILLDILAPILLMFGLLTTNASTAALLNNFEIIFTGLIAMIFFKEHIGKKMWIAISIIIASGFLLSFEDFSGFHVSLGALLVLAASFSWGLENNCTRMLSHHDPLYVVILKGLGSGLGALLIAIALNEFGGNWIYLVLALLLGFVSYGMSLFFYISAQRHLGALRTSAYYATAPFAGALFSFLLLRESLSWQFVIAFLLMALGTYFAIKENQTKS